MNRSPTQMRWKRHRVGGEREGKEENLVKVAKVTREESIDPKKPSLFSSTRMLVWRKSLRDLSKKEKNEDSSKRKSTKKSKTKNLVKKNTDDDGLQLEHLMDDVQLHVLEFLSPASARALMSTSHRYRRLLQGEKALSYWKHWCHKLWPDCAQDASFVDSLNLPTAAGHFYKEANLSLLLSMAKPSPSKIDESLFNDQEKNLLELKQPPQDVELVTPDVTKAPQARHSCEQMVQFKGEVGTGNRCIRSDLPLAACPTSSPNKKKSTLRRLLGDSGLSCRGMSSSSSAVVLAGPQPPPSSAAVLHQEGECPFVVPHTGSDGQIHLTPRFISYYEVTISDKNKEHDGTTNHSSSHSSTHDEDTLRPPTGEEEEEGPRPECVAVGLAAEDFPLDSRMPGWNSFSIGYHGDNGCLYYCTGGTFEMKEFGPTFSMGDTVGCGIDSVMRDVFFTLNGKFLGYACAKNLFLLDAMYPTVGLDTNAPVGCNFGSQPFLYDLSSTVQQHGSIVRNRFSF